MHKGKDGLLSPHPYTASRPPKRISSFTPTTLLNKSARLS